MKASIRMAVATAAMMFAVPSTATTILPGTMNVPPTPGVPPGQGTLLASKTDTGTAFTFAATFNQAVYRNAAGTLDFYYQILRTGPGSVSDNEIRSFTLSVFDSLMVDGFSSLADPDGAGLFVAANNPNLATGVPSPSTTSFGRSPSGNVLSVNFGPNGLSGTENSETFIFRTDAINFNELGTFGIIDGSTWQGRTYQPLSSAVPEPATWAMMILGIGVVGSTMRRRRNSALAVA